MSNSSGCFRRILSASTRYTLIVAVGVFIAVLAGTILTTNHLLNSAAQEGEVQARDTAAAVAGQVAANVRFALDLGIPLEEMRGVEDFLNGILGATVSVSSIEIADVTGKTLFRAPTAAEPGPAADGAPEHTQFDGTPARANLPGGAQVIATPSNAIVQRTQRTISIVAPAIAVLIALGAAVLTRVWLLEHRDLPLTAFAASGFAVGRGIFADVTSPNSTSLKPLALAMARLTAPIRRRYRAQLLVIEELEAIDTNKQFEGEIETAIKPINDLVVGVPFRIEERQYPPWNVALPLTFIAGAFPLWATLASNAIGVTADPRLSAALILGVGAIAAVLGLTFATVFGSIVGRASLSLAFMVSGFCLLAVPFVDEEAAIVALAAGCAVSATFGFGIVHAADGWRSRISLNAAILIVAPLSLGPLLGSLLVEAEGEMPAFASLGVLTVLSSLLVLSGRPMKAISLQNASTAQPLLMLVALLGGGWFVVELPLRVAGEDSTSLILHLALAASAALALTLLPIHERVCWLVSGLCILAFIAATTFEGLTVDLVTTLTVSLAVACGVLYRRGVFAAPTFLGPAAAICVVAAAEAIAYAFDLPFLYVISAATVVAGCLIVLFGRLGRG